MTAHRPHLDDLIEALLADPQYEGHPLREALDRLWRNSGEQLERLERLTHISDGFQRMARDQSTTLQQRYDRQLRKLEKAARISDRYQDMLRDLNTALQEASTHDHLTGLANRRKLIDVLKAESQRADRQNHTYALAMLDVDHFKQVNDRFGHDGGDRILIDIARTLEANLREYDLCGRWGGEEFLIILPQTPLDDAQQVLGRIQEAARRLTIPAGAEESAPFAVTVSIGLTEHRPGEGFFDTVNRADEALLTAKRTGRDCCRQA